MVDPVPRRRGGCVAASHAAALSAHPLTQKIKSQSRMDKKYRNDRRRGGRRKGDDPCINAKMD
ncbi:hypothetical protein BVI2075_1350008 [Burkholderia vietnamiensis]|nr:hypothetical protein BVI2075_1350008 [Burkholderia vietnamiensis]